MKFLYVSLIALALASQALAQQPVVLNKFPLNVASSSQLPLGSIKAKGWLLKQLENQKNGATGYAEELYDDDNHLGKNTDWLGGTGSGWEKVPYYVKGLVALAYTLDDAQLKQKAQKYIDWTLDNQRADGLFGPPKMKDWWPRMPMMYALQSYYEATNDKRVIPFLSKYFKYELANLDKDPLKDWGKSRAADNMEIVLWLYNRTGDRDLLKLAEKLNQQAYPWVSIFNNNEFYFYGDDFQPKHMVNVGQALKFPLVYSQINQDKTVKGAMDKGIKHLMHDHGLPVGLGSGTEFLGGKASIEGVETCTVVEWMQSLETALRIQQDVNWADRLERIAFNSLPAQFDRHYKNHSYYTLPNQVVAVKGGQGFNQDYGTGIISSPYSGFECCRYNMHMGWPYFVKNSVVSTPSKGLAFLTYGPMEIKTLVNGNQKVTITEETNYPFDEQIVLSISGLKSPSNFALDLRIPAWCKNPTLKINGKATAVKSGEMAKINRKWANGDQVLLNFPMDIETEPQVNNSISVVRGPLVYSLELGEEKKSIKKLKVAGFEEYEILPTKDWNYALLPDLKTFKVQRGVMPENPFDYQNTPIKIQVSGKKLTDWKLSQSGTSALDVPFGPVQSEEKLEELTLVPYGSSNLRLSCIPILGISQWQTKSFSESFDLGMPTDWIFYGGGWFTKDGAAYAASNAGSGGYGIRGSKLIANNTSFADFTYQSDVKITSKGDAGLVFRVTEAAIGPDAYKGYYVGLNPVTQIVNFGKADHKWTSIKSEKLTLETNKNYHLKVEAKGNDFAFYVDGKLVLTAKDDSFKRGSLGLRTYEAQAMYDNVKVENL